MITTRRAGPSDVDVLVDLRRVMFEAMGVAGPGWEDAARAWFLEQTWPTMRRRRP